VSAQVDDEVVAAIAEYKIRIAERDQIIDGVLDHAARSRTDVQIPRRALDWTSLAERTPPEREWAIEGWLGRGHITMMAGPPGAGKTALAQSLASCMALGLEAVGTVQKPLRVLCWFGEDDHDELWRRQTAIADWLGQPLTAFAPNLIIESYANEDITLAHQIGGQLQPTQLMTALREQINDYRADVVILDSIARTFGGNEVDRHQVTTFTAHLTAAIAERNAAMLLLGHPAKAKDSEFSGSTAWEASVRARWYFGFKLPDQKETEADEDPDANVRWLAKRKTNYSTQDVREVRYHNGCMQPSVPADAGTPFRGLSNEFCKNECIQIMTRLSQMGMDVSRVKQSGSYFPKVAKTAGLLGAAFTEKDLLRGLAECMKAGLVVEGEVGMYANRTPKRGLKFA